jgi:hypothetical protein
MVRTESRYLNGKRDSVWFEHVDSEVTAEPEVVAAQRARMHPLGPDAQDLHEAVRTLQNLQEELPQGACPLREAP